MKLTDIIAAGSGNGIKSAWDETTAAGDFGPLPAGEYIARIIDGKLKQSKQSTPGYGLTFEVVEPTEYKGRKFWHDCWLTQAAMPQTKRDLGKLGVRSLEQLGNSLPKYFRCKCKLALRRDDDGNEANRLKTFEVLGIDKPEADAFAPTEPVVAPNQASESTASTEQQFDSDGNPLPF